MLMGLIPPANLYAGCILISWKLRISFKICILTTSPFGRKVTLLNPNQDGLCFHFAFFPARYLLGMDQISGRSGPSTVTYNLMKWNTQFRKNLIFGPFRLHLAPRGSNIRNNSRSFLIYRPPPIKKNPSAYYFWHRWQQCWIYMFHFRLYIWYDVCVIRLKNCKPCR